MLLAVLYTLHQADEDPEHGGADDGLAVPSGANGEGEGDRKSVV